MNDKILFVDDDPKLLAGFKRNFRRLFNFDTAEGGESALAKIASDGPYAVVVSDRQMPGMDGVTFLTLVKERAPDTIRLMLTGNADLDSTVRVVNEGNIFRFLTKPCDLNDLAKAVQAAINQHHLVTAEKELLGKTLNGSIKLLTDILSMVDSQTFRRTQLLRDVLSEVTEKLGLASAWEIHLAIMLAPIGLVTVPPETILRWRSGQALSDGEKHIITRLPETAAHLVTNIPRLEGVAKIIRYQQKNYDGSGSPHDALAGEDIPVGARMLKILFDMYDSQTRGMNRVQALDKMRGTHGRYDAILLNAIFASLEGKPIELAPPSETRWVAVTDLKPGMVLNSHVFTTDGLLILSMGQELSEITIEKVRNFHELSGVKGPISVREHESLVTA